MKVPFVVCILPRTTTTHNQGLLLLHWTTNVLVYLTFNSRTEIVISQNSQRDLQSTICQIDRHATHLHGHWILVGVTLIWINTRPQPFIRNLRPSISSSSTLTRPPTFSAAGWWRNPIDEGLMRFALICMQFIILEDLCMSFRYRSIHTYPPTHSVRWCLSGWGRRREQQCHLGRSY